MKKRIASFLVLLTILISSLQPARRGVIVATPAVPVQPKAVTQVVSAVPSLGQPQPVKERVVSEPSIHQLKGQMDRLTDEEIRQIVNRAAEEIKRRLAADPKGDRRTEAETTALATELNRESAARLLLIDRKLDGMRKKYL